MFAREKKSISLSGNCSTQCLQHSHLRSRCVWQDSLIVTRDLSPSVLIHVPLISRLYFQGIKSNGFRKKYNWFSDLHYVLLALFFWAFLRDSSVHCSWDIAHLSVYCFGWLKWTINPSNQSFLKALAVVIPSALKTIILIGFMGQTFLISVSIIFPNFKLVKFVSEMCPYTFCI